MRKVLLLIASLLGTYFVMKWCGMLNYAWLWTMIAVFPFTSVMRFARGSTPIANVLQQLCELALLILVVLSIFWGQGKWWFGLVAYFLLASSIGSTWSAICRTSKSSTASVITISIGLLAAPTLTIASYVLLFTK